jgi:Xaa-Pro aminopeptidase
MQLYYLGSLLNSVAGRIRKVMQKSQADVIFLMNTGQKDSNFFYLTGFTSGEFEYNALIVTKKGLILPVSSLEYEIAKKQRPKEMKIIKIATRKESRSIFKKYMKSKIVGLNLSFLPYNDYKVIKKVAKPKKIVDVSKAFYDARSTKDKIEIDCIRVANRISKKSLEELNPYLKKGMTEKEVGLII